MRTSFRIQPPTLFLDVAGRFSRNPNYPIVVAGVAVPSNAIDEIRRALLSVTNGRIIKWKESSGEVETIKRIFRTIMKRQLAVFISYMRKHEPEWSQYWEEGTRLETVMNKLQTPAPYAKAGVVLRYHVYCHGIASVTGLYLGRHGASPRPKRTQSLKIQAICDSDIQGEANLQMFKDIFDKAGTLHRTVQATGLDLAFDPTVSTEQQEPILMLPDHIAGYIYSRNAYQEEKNNAIREQLIGELNALTDSWPSHVLRCEDYPFKDKFPIDIKAYEHAAREEKNGHSPFK